MASRRPGTSASRARCSVAGADLPQLRNPVTGIAAVVAGCAAVAACAAAEAEHHRRHRGRGGGGRVGWPRAPVAWGAGPWSSLEIFFTTQMAAIALACCAFFLCPRRPADAAVVARGPALCAVAARRRGGPGTGDDAGAVDRHLCDARIFGALAGLAFTPGGAACSGNHRLRHVRCWRCGSGWVGSPPRAGDEQLALVRRGAHVSCLQDGGLEHLTPNSTATAPDPP